MKRITKFSTVVLILLGTVGWIMFINPKNITGSFVVSKVLLATNTAVVTKTPTGTPFQPLTDTPTPTTSHTATLTPTPSQTPTLTPTATPSLTPTASLTLTPSHTPTPMDKASIEGIRGRWPAFSLSCESRSAVDWAAYFGVQIDEVKFHNSLPVSDDPDLGFVGDVNGAWGQIPPYPYGVHAEPVAKLLRDYELKAEARTGMTFDELKAEISASRPVILWVVGRVGEGTPIPYTSSEGRETTVARFEHTVILIGYDGQEVTLLDGYWVYTRLIRDLLESWGVLGNMAVVWSGE